MISSQIEPSERQALLAELASLSPKSPRSKLEPYRDLIRELRRKGRTYRELSQIFAERFGFYVALSTLHSFVKVRARHRKQIQFELPPAEAVGAQLPTLEQVIALRAKPTVKEAKRPRFVFRENEPLTLNMDGGTQ